jgi:two-component system cell cycle sensor histidine kinase/response regulator CckA
MKEASVLVVDDYRNVRKTLERALKSVGYTVFLAASGDEALGILKEHQVDAVVLDLHMPVMSGQTLFHLIIGTWPALKTRVLIMTGDARVEEKEAWLKLYDLPVVKKPFALDEVLTLIDVLTGDQRRVANGS